MKFYPVKVLSFLFISFLFIPSFSYSASLSLNKIGSLDLGGNNYTEWWYTGENPIFYGSASPNSEVSVKIGDSTYKVNSDDQGNWSYPAQILKGDYQILITQGNESITFTLHLGQNLPASTSSPTEESTVPATGSNQIVSMAMGVGVLLLATYFYISGDPRRRSVFEAKMLKED